LIAYQKQRPIFISCAAGTAIHLHYYLFFIHYSLFCCHKQQN
jgi:hypothetical protein